MNKRYNILIFGPQASGKGTQAEMLSRSLAIPHISPGAMYRAMQKRATPLATIITPYLDRGELVPDKYTNDMMKNRLQENDTASGFILDGYPRNTVQMEFLLETNIPIDYLIHISIPDNIVLERVAGRRIGPNGETYHLIYNPPPAHIDPAQLHVRSDETPEAIKQRLAIYHSETEPLIEALRKRGVTVISTDGTPPIKGVSEAIKKELGLVP